LVDIPSSLAKAYTLLESALERVLAAYALVDEVVERTQTTFAEDGSDDAALRELFKLLRPEEELSGLTSKQWQDVRLRPFLCFAP
jgi:hypothetical protein